MIDEAEACMTRYCHQGLTCCSFLFKLLFLLYAALHGHRRESLVFAIRRQMSASARVHVGLTMMKAQGVVLGVLLSLPTLAYRH